jgi:hypothetical protein
VSCRPRRNIDKQLIDSGYFIKRVMRKPDWLQVPGVLEVCSVSNCISVPPEGWVERWLHNEFGWFNRSADAVGLAPAGSLTEYRLFAYRLYPEVFRRNSRAPLVVPSDVRPDPIPKTFQSLGFDSVSRSMESVLGFECSPLSCNSMAAEWNVNERCLFPSLELALAGADRFATDQPEPGNYYVVEVLEDRMAAAG